MKYFQILRYYISNTNIKSNYTTKVTKIKKVRNKNDKEYIDFRTKWQNYQKD